jgi:hypothetical protein
VRWDLSPISYGVAAESIHRTQIRSGATACHSILSLISNCVAALCCQKELPGREHASGVGTRIGMRAGIWAVLVGGSVLFLMATPASYSATLAALDGFHRGQIWLLLAVSLAFVLPRVLFGFLGGVMDAGAIAKKLLIQKSDQPSIPLPKLKWLVGSIAAAVVIAFAAPIS